MVKVFGGIFGFHFFISEVVYDKKFKSAWPVLEPDKNLRHCIHNFYYKSVKRGAPVSIIITDLLFDPNDNSCHDNTQ